MMNYKRLLVFFTVSIYGVAACTDEKHIQDNRQLMTLDDKQGNIKGDVNVPDYLKRWPGLFVRSGKRIVEAPAEDVRIAQAYPSWLDKGAIVDGKRITILTKQKSYRVNQEIRIIHVFDATESGQEVYVMGPKEIYGEYVNDRLVSEPVPDTKEPWVPELYDGTILPGPAVDYNYDITTYAFSKPGIYRIYWKMASLISNTLELGVTETARH